MEIFISTSLQESLAIISSKSVKRFTEASLIMPQYLQELLFDSLHE